MKTYLTKRYIGVKIVILLSICVITLAITSCNKNQVKDVDSISVEQDDTENINNLGVHMDSWDTLCFFSN